MIHGPARNATVALALVVAVAALISPSCSSRYRLDLYMQLEDQRQQVKVETTEYVKDAELGNVLAEAKIRPGSGNVVVATTGARWPGDGKAGLSIMGYDEYLRSQLFLALPAAPKPDSFSLAGNSFVTILGRYDRSVEDKAFLPERGFFLIDSIASGRLYLTVDGAFRNRNGVELAVDGQMKVKADVGL